MVEKTVFLEAKRTPIGKFGGNFVSITATELGTTVIKAITALKPQLKSKINEVIMGNVLSAGLGQNPARIAAMSAGLSEKIPSYTVNKVCGSGLKSVILGSQSIANGQADLIIAGGMENMSRCPYVLENHRFGTKLGNQELKDILVVDGLFCSIIGQHMGITAENIARRFKISRKEQDVYAFKSHQKALQAMKSGKLKSEIVPVKMVQNDGLTMVDQDEQPRKDTSIQSLTQLKPAFKKNGTVTAGNACPLNDGAAAVLLSSEKFAEKEKVKPLMRIISYASIGLDPEYMGLGSYYAAKECLRKAEMSVSDIDLWEINEAFASQSLAVIRKLAIDDKKVNVNGGALAYGHPIGASGSRILVTLIHEMKRRKVKYGIASLCIGGGQGIALLVENYEKKNGF